MGRKNIIVIAIGIFIIFILLIGGIYYFSSQKVTNVNKSIKVPISDNKPVEVEKELQTIEQKSRDV